MYFPVTLANHSWEGHISIGNFQGWAEVGSRSTHLHYMAHVTMLWEIRYTHFMFLEKDLQYPHDTTFS